MAQSGNKQANSLFEDALNASYKVESQWTQLSEEYITPQVIRQLAKAVICTGQYGLYGQLKLKDGRLKSLPLAWETRQIVEAGDCLKLSSLRLIQLSHQETGEIKVFLAGIPE